MDTEFLLDTVIGAAIEVHRALGPGLLESAYHRCLLIELGHAGLRCESEAPVAVAYKGEVVEVAYRADMLVEDRILLELKAVERLTEKHKAQMLTYLRLMNVRIGLLINFNEVLLKHGIRRVVNGYE